MSGRPSRTTTSRIWLTDARVHLAEEAPRNETNGESAQGISGALDRSGDSSTANQIWVTGAVETVGKFGVGHIRLAEIVVEMRKYRERGEVVSLNKEGRKARDDARFRERVEQKRESGEDVVAYALANGKAYKFLTAREKEELKFRRIRCNARQDARMDLDLAIASVMLRALKDGVDPDGPETKATIKELKAQFRKDFPA
ncbi:hypothetical protein [Roseibium sp. RKSG952]|uniref:hypothetical protein n=1 Tax=Roseibium sp. RKSG952 TaxID=2529384 RepID=UPI0018AD0EFA|nr:hypothetical protein [Roseibium sp. RKSG952]